MFIFAGLEQPHIRPLLILCSRLATLDGTISEKIITQTLKLE